MSNLTEGLNLGKVSSQTLQKCRKELQIQNLIAIKSLGILTEEQDNKVNSILTRYVDNINLKTE